MGSNIMSSASDMSNVDYIPLIPHVFLPLILPKCQDNDTETDLLKLTTLVINELHVHNEKILAKIFTTFNTWNLIQREENLDPKTINSALKNLFPGDDFALYIREQNAGLLITIPDNDYNSNSTNDEIDELCKDSLFSTFPTSQPAELVTSSMHLASIFPTTSVSVNSKFLKSKSFSRQLSALHLYQTRQSMAVVHKAGTTTAELREVANPMFVSQWLTATLADETSKQSTNAQMPRIVKKVRDRIIFDRGAPFRRSGLWMCIKVVLQLCLTRQLGEINGKFLYKLIILKVMLRIVNFGDVNIGLKMHMTGKIARRTWKLEIYKNSNAIEKSLVVLFDEITTETARILKKVRSTLKTDWDDFIEAEKKDSSVTGIHGNLETRHSLKNNGLNEYLSMDHKKVLANVSDMHIPEPLAAPRHFQEDVKYPRSHFFDTNPNNIPTLLHDFEMNVSNWGNIPINIDDSDYVWAIFQDYVLKGRHFYQSDPVGFSRFILTCLKIIQFWDQIVIQRYPLLAEHRPGVDMSFTHMLILPGRTALYTLSKLEEYFEKRKSDATYPSLIEEQETFVHSFSSRYAKNNSEMQHIKQRILEFSKHQETSTLEKVHVKRSECETLQTIIKSLECEYEYTDWKRVHNVLCKKCALIQKEKRCVVKVFEKPLPINEECQDAVVFELNCPSSIATLRDLLYIFGVSVTSSITIEDKNLYGPWIRNNAISKCSNQSQAYVVNLMSSNKLFLETHYNTHHALNPDSDFVVNNGFNLRLAGKNQLFQHTSPASVKLYCTFKVKKKSPYSNLQWAINGTECTFNQVLARMNECHRDLSLMEFVEFGSLRCGTLIQLRSLYRAITQMTLSLKTESVFNLISQCLWEAGPNTSGVFYRDALIDLTDHKFIYEFLKIMEQLRKKHQHNWKDHYVLLTIIQFSLRILSLSDHNQIVQVAFILLNRCREVTLKWSNDIQKILVSTVDAPRSEIDALRVKMIEVNATCAITYSIDPHHYQNLRSPDIILGWLITVANIWDNSILLGSGHESQKEVFRTFSGTLQNLLRRVHDTGLNLEPFLDQVLHEDSQVLTKFVEVTYSESNFFRCPNPNGNYRVNWKQYPTSKNVYFCRIELPETGTVSVLQMDVLGGSFLVNGSPVSYLPSSIENHPEFQRVFPMKSFEVRPYAFQKGRFITRDKFLGSCYSFFLKTENNTLVITEHFGTDEAKELIPPKLLVNNIPHILVEEFTHWWNKKAKVIELFKRDSARPLKLYNKAPNYRIELGQRILTDLSFYTRPGGFERSRVMVDITCGPYSKIVDIIKRLEHWKYVNIWYNIEGDRRTHLVEIPRMGLQFTVSFPGKYKWPVLMSKEYRGMKVADCQKFGSLVGLKNGLLLEDASKHSKSKMPSILLMPHGTVVIHGSHNVEIYVKKLRAPAFFTYELDERLRQLKARESQCAWLFLAYLHAATSSVLPDPFTQVTGTERAFQILQSGNCWSCQPIDIESKRTLSDIAKLTPSREFYPPTMRTMEKVNWGPCLPDDQIMPLLPQISHDGYQLIVDKLLQDSQRLQFLFPNDGQTADQNTATEQFPIIFKSNQELCQRSYWQRVGLSTTEGRISAMFSEEFDLRNAPEIQPIPFPSAFHLTFTDERMKAILCISQQGHNWTYCPPASPVNLIKNLLLTGPDLKGVCEGDFANFQKDEDCRSWSAMDFRDSWLDLYNFARQIEERSMQSEWIHLLTILAFRDVNLIQLEHLLFLQTIAVNRDKFTNLNSPLHREYAMTNEYTFDPNEVKHILKTFCTSWEDYMNDRSDEQLPDESIGDFVDRMQPIYHETVDSQAEALTEVLEKSWPLYSCDKLIMFQESAQLEHYDLLNCLDAAQDLNVVLKNWFNNLELCTFLSKVELEVNSLKQPNDKFAVFRDNSRHLLKHSEQKQLKQFCKKPLFTVNLEDILDARAESSIDKVLLSKSIQMFDIQNTANAESVAEISKSNNNLEAFPLEARLKCPILDTYMTELTDSWAENENNNLKRQAKLKSVSKSTPYAPWIAKLTSDRIKMNELWERVKGAVKPIGTLCDNITTALISAEIFPRTTPLTLLPLLYNHYDESKQPYLYYIQNLLGAYAVQVTIEQRSARCAKYCSNPKGRASFQMELESEQENPGHENWNPAKKPAWLLFEIEMDVMIRAIQANVAEKMENPSNNENALLQLNMGEGKTAVIVPLLILSLANGNQLCRLTVLKSLYEINHKALISTLGGILLSRRVYTFPCRRDYVLGQLELQNILEVYQECMTKCGVVIALPEYRLSFQLKAYEKCGSEKYIDGRQFLKVHEWLENNSRDILDESDEILQVKYQLIYTIGKQLGVGGGSMRFLVTQKLLKLIPNHLKALIKENGDDSIEVTERSDPNGYPFCRLLKPDCYDQLCTLLASDIIGGNSGIQIQAVSSRSKGMVLEFLTNSLVDRCTINSTFELFPLDVHREILLILRGLLACGVLCTALTKRWRVNYGVNPSGYRRVAVPFRAKDVAAERTEFGHPDIAIVLTQLCYYYSGLTNEQLDQCFTHLFLQPDPSVEYNHWISLLPQKMEGIDSIRVLSGVNLKDFYQRTQVLFPALRFNTGTIDFWLSTVVFPIESKQFAWKIGCSPWDLCDEKSLPTTGFSGTNDSKLLLPKTISQKDLAELQGTNGFVLKNLLKSENNNFEALRAGFSGRDILKKLVENHYYVLLDVGALMLELNNEQVAETWLDMEEEDYVDAAVYFDQNNKLVVMDRMQRRPVSLELSTYRNRLDRCVIYLDDVHTRGTDLKIPAGTRACVTLGKGVTKDKLVQGCMRMRKLGQGHFVVFWASCEVDNAIKALMGSRSDPIGSKQVLEWAIENSRAAIEDGFIHWASAGVYQAQKLSAHYLFEKSDQADQDLKLLAESCSQKETTELKIMYGDVRSVQLFPTIVTFLLKRVKREMQKRLVRAGKDVQHSVESIVASFGEVVVRHTSKYVANVLRSSQTTDEEQERELEHELEAQKEKEVPPKYKALDHYIHPAVERFIVTGDLHGIEKWAVKLPLALQKTRIWNLCKVDTWAQHIYTTLDFQNVTKSTNKNEILRPPHWICSLSFDDVEPRSQRHENRSTILLVISPFEANHFISFMRFQNIRTNLHMYAPRLSPDQDTLIHNKKLAVRLMPSNITSVVSPYMNACLLLFSGSSYFKSKEEQDEYCKVAGFCLQDYSEEAKRVLEDGGIVDGLFVKPEFRVRLGLTNCHFKENPETLIREIIHARCGTFSTESHVGKIIHQCRNDI